MPVSMQLLQDYIWEQLNQRGWLPADLARKSGLCVATIGNVLNHKHGPSVRFFQRVAQAFDVPITELLEAAGLIPPEPPETKLEKRLLRFFRKMSPFQRRIVMAVVETVHGTETEP